MYCQLQVSTLPIEEIEFGLLPTPMAQSRETTEEKTLKRKEKYGGMKRAMYLENFLAMGMLPTPTTHDSKHSTTKSPSWNKQIEQKHLAETVLNPYIQEAGGKPSQLSPQFVMEMMGFPTDWTLLPFQNGEKNQLKPEETQSSHK
jgi:hypothetical protein